MTCTACKNEATRSILIRAESDPPDHKGPYKSRIEVVPLCDSHMNKILRILANK